VNVSCATVGERDAALRLLVSHRPTTDRDRAVQHYRDLFSAGGLDPAGLFVSRDAKGSIRGTMVVAVMPGAAGLVWPPVVARRSSGVADALVIAACGWLRSQGVKVCQAFGLDEDRDSFAPLERNGFEKLTRIIEMRGKVPALRSEASRLSLEPITDSNRAAFNAALLASYEGSLDCPEANGDRTDADLLAPYADADPGLWRLAKLNDEPAGVLLLETDPRTSGCVLSYVGLAPKFRRRRFGSELMRAALELARNASHDVLALSVDERNHPAIRLYETVGFQASGARSVFLARWPALS
jgi:ribosomal protein S18 acetylase RimI-like enzyme